MCFESFSRVLPKVPILKEVNFGKMQLCRVEHFYNIFVLNSIKAIVFSNHAQKWGQICWKSVQLDRVAFFRCDFFQNWYFNNIGFFSNKRHGKKSYCNFMLSLYQKPYVLEIKLPYTKLFYCHCYFKDKLHMVHWRWESVQ